MALYLVTGGCGFIGSHLCEALLAQGHAVRVLDDLSTGTLANLPSAATFIRGSVTDPVATANALEGSHGCFHLAAVASVERCRLDWGGAHSVNLTGTVTLLEAIARRPQRERIPFVYASSAAVYGNSNALPITEDSAKRPTSAYGADKYACELHASVAAEVHAIPSTGLRFFNVYGPRQNPASPYSGVISIFADRIRQGGPLAIFGDGNQTRDFVAVADVVSALIQAMTRRQVGAEVYNVCTGHPTSVLALASLLGSIFGNRPNLEFRPSRVGEIKHSVGSNLNARTGMDWSPKTPLDFGLKATLQWMAGQ